MNSIARIGRDFDESTSPTLLDRIRASDSGAWRRFVELYGPTIFGWARRAALQPHDAADVTQEVFRAVAGSITRFRRDRPTDSFRAWLRTITANKVSDLFRRRPNHLVGSSDVDDLLAQIPDAEEGTSGQASQAATDLAHRALELIRTEFEPTTWQAFLECVVDGRTPQETACRLGLTVAAVYKAKSRVLIRLRREFDGLLD